MAQAKKRADGRYCSQIYLGRDEAGKKRYKSIYAKSPAELKEKETAVRLQLGRGLDVLSQRDSFGQWADDIERVLLILADKGLSQRTISLYRSTIRQIMRRAVGLDIDLCGKCFAVCAYTQNYLQNAAQPAEATCLQSSGR